jgi:hypothetical protein
MTLVTFSICIIALLLTLLLDLRVSRVLRRGTKTRATKAALALWPLQVLLHIVVFFLVASTRPAPTFRPQVHMSRRYVPGPFFPSLPPSHWEGKKARVERL